MNVLSRSERRLCKATMQGDYARRLCVLTFHKLYSTEDLQDVLIALCRTEFASSPAACVEMHLYVPLNMHYPLIRILRTQDSGLRTSSSSLKPIRSTTSASVGNEVASKP